jgi:hypothetical protein
MTLMKAKAVFGLAGLVAIAVVLYLDISGGNTAHLMTFQKLEETNMEATSMDAPVAPVAVPVAVVPENVAVAVPVALVAPVAEAPVAPVTTGAEEVTAADVEKVSQGDVTVLVAKAAAARADATAMEAHAAAAAIEVENNETSVPSAPTALDTAAKDAPSLTPEQEESRKLRLQTLGTLKARLAQIQEQADAKLLIVQNRMNNATEMKSEETRALKAEVHALKTQAKSYKDAVRDKKVRKTPSWPRSWANFSLL